MLAASVAAPGGLLCAASCSSHFGKEEFLESIAAGVRQAGLRWVFESLQGPGSITRSFPRSLKVIT